jgi:hypothetical protein
MATRVVFLFGAGASFGAGGIDNSPPLGNALFSELIKCFPDTWGNLPPEFSAKFRERFETGIEACYGKYPSLAILLNRMGRYFAQFRIDEYQRNLYYRLIERFRSRFASSEFLISTINYECLIELAALPIFNEIQYWGFSHGLRVLKLHGSCNFFATHIHVGKHTKFDIGTARIHAPLKVVPYERVIEELVRNQVPPAMSLYAREKTNIICDPKIREIQTEFHEAVKQAEFVIVIGANPYPDDRHIWEHLRATDAELILIANEGACKDWLKGNRQGKRSTWLSSKFADGFENLCNLL